MIVLYLVKIFDLMDIYTFWFDVSIKI